MLRGLGPDLRFALRNLTHYPSFSLLAVVALALGLGASIAIFSVLYAVALRPLPYPESDRLVSLAEIDPTGPTGGVGGFQLEYLREWSERSRTIEALGGYMPTGLTLSGREEPVRLEALRVTPGVFAALRTAPTLGRTFEQAEVDRGEVQLAVLSDATWARFFERDPEILGTQVQLDGAPYSIIGVMPPNFAFPDQSVELWTPLAWQDESESEGPQRHILLPAVGRLAPGVTLEQASAESQILLDELNNERRQARAQRVAQRASAPAGDPADGQRRIVRRAPPGGEQARQPGPGERRVVRRVVRRDPADIDGADTDESEPAPRIAEAPAHDPAQSPAHGEDSRTAPDPTEEAERAESPPPSQPTPPAQLTQRELRVTPLLERVLEPVRPALGLLGWSVLLVLLVACVNVANLLLTRGVRRRRELATRAALGSSRGELMRLLLCESAVLSTLGGALGLAVAWLGLRALRQLVPEDVPRGSEIGLFPPVVLFALALVFVCTIVFGTVPILQTRFGHLVGALGRDSTLLGGGRPVQAILRNGLAVAEIALALLLLVAAGLFANSFLTLMRVDPGYQPLGVLTAQVAPPPSRYPPGDARNNFYSQLLERTRELPEVEEAGVVNFLPLFPGRVVLRFQMEGQAPPTDPREAPQGDLRVVTDGYLEAMGIPLREGRVFDQRDRSAEAPLLLVNEVFADRFLEQGRAVGSRLAGFGEVIGVVGNVRAQGLDSEVEPTVYAMLEHAPPMMSEIFTRMSIAVRSERPLELVPALRTALASLDPDIALEDLALMDERLFQSTSWPRFYALALSVFAGVGLILAMVGVYGVLAFTVSQETRETGVRMALGAEPQRLLWRTLWRGARIALLGIGIGVVAALAMSRVVASLLFGLDPTDPLTYTAVAAALLATALLACWVPARRVAKANPVEALRHD